MHYYDCAACGTVLQMARYSFHLLRDGHTNWTSCSRCRAPCRYYAWRRGREHVGDDQPAPPEQWPEWLMDDDDSTTTPHEDAASGLVDDKQHAPQDPQVDLC